MRRCVSCGRPTGTGVCGRCAPPLFPAEHSGGVRASDPVTSRVASAANQVARQSQRKDILRWMLANGRCTARDVAHLTSGQNGTASKRLGDAEKDGLVRVCGYEYPPHGGTARHVYELTDAGVRDATLLVGAA